TSVRQKFLSIPAAKNISVFPNTELLYGLLILLRQEGRTRRHERGAGCDGRECALTNSTDADGKIVWS
ncbi:MAG: hypothetical protein ACREDL_19075, partial [Bradyrhizobium sp.]